MWATRQISALLGYNAVGNFSGVLGGLTAGIPGGSATATYSICSNDLKNLFK